MTRYILPKKFCHDQHVFKWLHDNVGFKHHSWNSDITIMKHRGDRLIEFRIYNDGMRALFHLTFNDHFIKLSNPEYVALFSPLFGS